MSFFNDIGHFFVKIGKGIAGFFTNLDEKKVVSVLQRSADIAKAAMPYVKLVAQATPTTVDDSIVAVVETLGIPLEKVLEKAVSGLGEILHDGSRQRVVVELVRQDLVKRVESGEKIQIGDIVYTNAAQVLGLSKTELIDGVTTAYNLFKNASKA